MLGGVAEDELDRIFESFYRAKTSRADESARGSGLGLAIASPAIALNGGSLSARSTGRGLCVGARLPPVRTTSGSGNPWRRSS